MAEYSFNYGRAENVDNCEIDIVTITDIENNSYNILRLKRNLGVSVTTNDTVRIAVGSLTQGYPVQPLAFTNGIVGVNYYGKSALLRKVSSTGTCSLRTSCTTTGYTYFVVMNGNSDIINSGSYMGTDADAIVIPIVAYNEFDNKYLYLIRAILYVENTYTSYLISNTYTEHSTCVTDVITGYASGSYAGKPSQAAFDAINTFMANAVPYGGQDPYDNAGDSDTGGGGGSWDDGSDPVNIPSLPSVGATNTGFITLFVPTQSQLKQVAEYLWGGLFDISTYLRLFEDPMDCILGLSVVPVSVPTSGSATITVGNIELSGISLPVASQQYIEVDCGSLTVSPYFGSYLDYEPYTKMSLFVPYSGVHTVNADDLMGRTVNLVYHIDILTGSLVAFLKCGDSVLYEFNGACGSNIPVNSMNYASTIENAIRIAVNIGTTVATAGASAPLTGADAGKRTAYQQFGRGVSLAGSTADGALSLKPNIDRAGSLGGTTGLLGNQIPYFIITRPRLCKPKNQNKIKGYPAFINYSISDLVGKGYTEFDTILLKNLYLTDDEKNELESILEGGVYL